MSAEQVTADVVDFAVAAYREDGQWVAVALPAAAVVTAAGFVGALRQFPGEDGVFGVVSVADEFFVLAHTVRDGVRLVISDAGALVEWTLAQEAAALVDLPWAEADVEDFEAAGDVGMCADFGLTAAELIMICRDEEMYPDEQVRAVAKRLGFDRVLADALRSR